MIAKNIKYLRNKIRYSQQGLADSIDIKQKTLAKYKEGRNEPDIETLIKLSVFFGVFVDMLIKSDCSRIVTPEMALKIKGNAQEYDNNNYEMKKFDYAEKDWNKLPRLITVS